jgi:hypothetical protein
MASTTEEMRAPPGRPPQDSVATTTAVVGRTTSPATQILLTIVTLGIWSIVWVYRQHKDIVSYRGTGVGGGLGAVIYFFISPVTWFLLPHEVEAELYHRSGERSPVRTLVGLWLLLPIVGNFVWYFKVQAAINDFWVARGAPAPA